METATLETPRRLFGAKKQISIALRSPEGDKFCTVRYPTDAESCERMRNLGRVRRQNEAGEWETESVNSEVAHADLFRKIRLDADGGSFSGTEATQIIETVESANPTGCEPIGDRLYRIGMKVHAAETSHTLRTPSRAQIRAFSRSCFRVRGDRVRIMLEPFGELYDQLRVSSEGYSVPVPIVHKATAVSELLDAIGKERGEGEDSCRADPFWKLTDTNLY